MSSRPVPAALPQNPSQPSPGVADLAVLVPDGFQAQGVLSILRNHPDAFRKCGDRDPARQNGLQQVQWFPSGTIKVVWHWGVQEFAGTQEFTAYLQRGMP